MEQRHEFIRLALLEGANLRELCRRFGISPQSGYKWLRRWSAGEMELSDHSAPAGSQSTADRAGAGEARV